MASGQHRWPKEEEGLAREDGRAGSQVLLGQCHPYLPGSGEGSRGVAAAGSMAAETGPREQPQGFPPEQAECLAGPWESRLVVLSPISPSAAAQCEIWLWKEKGGEKPIM